MISFITGAIGKWLMIGGLGILTIGGAYALGWARGSATVEYKVKYAQAKADALAARKELENLRYIQEAQAKLAAKHLEKLKKEEARIAQLEEYIKTLPALDCPVPSDFLRQLPGAGD
jgi:hypothetical protein